MSPAATTGRGVRAAVPRAAIPAVEAAAALFQLGCSLALRGDRARACLIFDALIDRPAVSPEVRRSAERLLRSLDPDPA